MKGFTLQQITEAFQQLPARPKFNQFTVKIPVIIDYIESGVAYGAQVPSTPITAECTFNWDLTKGEWLLKVD